jgi:tetratricopeptide (TPR) repeat protein
MVLEAYSVSHGKASAYLPVVELLQGYFKIISDDDPRTRREKITGRVLALDRALEEPLPYLFALFGLADEKDALAGMDASIRKRRTLDAIKRIVLRESLNQPLVLIFEDLHWIDEQTQEFLNLFADSIGTAKILLLVNYRPEYSHSWSNKTYYEQIRLDPLGRESADEMLATLLGVDADLAPLKRLIIEKTEGTPFFMEEMVQALFEQQVLARNGRVHLTQPLSELKIPSTVQAMLSARIDRLPADEKDLLQTLAVIGREFSASLVHAVVGQYDDRLDTMLDDLQLREFIYEQPAAGEADYIFKHALTQEVAYSSILAERRQFLHSHIAQAIESLAGARVEEHIEELAHHYSRSANLAKAVHYLQRAGEQAAARSFHEAISYLSTAIEFLKKLPSSSARDAQELVIRMALVNPLFVINPLPVADLEQNLRRAQVPCKQLGKTEVMAHVLLNLFFVYWCIGDLGKQREAAQAGMEIASREPSEITVFCAGWTNGFLSAWTGQYDSARVHLERALSIRPSTEALLLKDPAIAISLVDCIEFLGFTLWMLGYPEQARRYEQRLADLANSSIDAFAWAVAVHGILMMRCQFFRDFRGMKQRAEELLRSASEGAASYWVVFGQVWLGRVTVAEGEFAAGIRMLEDGMNASFARGDAGTYDLFRYTAAATYLQAGVVERGMTAVREGITQIPATGLFSAELYRLQGEFLLLAGALEDEAEKSFRQAIRIAQPQGAKSWELRATMSLARLLAKQAKRDEARTMLAGIYDWFTEGFGTADLEEAKALLDKLIA